jgi:hypothetical protein
MKSGSRSRRYTGSVKSNVAPQDGRTGGRLTKFRGEADAVKPFSEGVAVPNPLRRSPRVPTQDAQPEREMHGTPHLVHYGPDHISREAEELSRRAIIDRHFVDGTPFYHHTDEKDNDNSLSWESQQAHGGANNDYKPTGRPQYPENATTGQRKFPR